MMTKTTSNTFVCFPTLLIVVLGIIAFSSSLDKNICENKYRIIHPEHSMCIPQNSTCKYRHGMEENIQSLLEFHNQVRNSIKQFVGHHYPEGRNMRNMDWDHELYLIAQQYALQCAEKPDCPLCHQTDRFHVEQNYAVKTFNSVNISINGTIERFKMVIKEWVQELREYEPAIVERFYNRGFSTNWTNIFRSTTLKVGCASMEFERETPDKITEVYVCNYGPAKLIEGEEIYKPNYTSCSNCPVGFHCNINELCKLYMEIDIPEHKKAAVLFLQNIFIDTPSCFAFCYTKDALNGWSFVTSTLFGIIVRTDSNEHVMVQLDKDSSTWSLAALDIPWRGIFVQVGIAVRSYTGVGEQTIQVKDLIILHGTCSSLGYK